MIQIDPGNPFDNDMPSNFHRLRIYMNELHLHSSLFFKEIEKVFKGNEEGLRELEEQNVPRPTLTYDSLGGEFTNIVLNAHSKSFFFVLRQCIDCVLKIVHQARGPLGFKDTGKDICNGSGSDRFGKFIRGLIDDQYNYDDEILACLKKNVPLFVGARLVRNSLKTQGVLDVRIVNREFIVFCHLSKMDTENDLLRFSKFGQSLEVVKRVVWIRPTYFQEAYVILYELVSLLGRKTGFEKILFPERSSGNGS